MEMVFPSPHDISVNEVFSVLATNQLDVKEVAAGEALVSVDTPITESAVLTAAIINANLDVSNASTLTFDSIAGGWSGVSFGNGIDGEGNTYRGQITLEGGCTLVMNGKSVTVKPDTRLIITEDT